MTQKIHQTRQANPVTCEDPEQDLAARYAELLLLRQAVQQAELVALTGSHNRAATWNGNCSNSKIVNLFSGFESRN